MNEALFVPAEGDASAREIDSRRVLLLEVHLSHCPKELGAAGPWTQKTGRGVLTLLHLPSEAAHLNSPKLTRLPLDDCATAMHPTSCPKIS